ncbi:hypothetical protein V8E51_006114 [Hyaloscypha variabilis]
MRLLDTTTLELKEFFRDGNKKDPSDLDSRGIPKYAILSHTWGKEEVSFGDMQRDRSNAMSKKGFDKIAVSCAIAASKHFRYLWVDTCCINKSSSTELSEAINSMFLCSRDEEFIEEFSSSRWFKEVKFYNGSWLYIGTRLDLIEPISAITRIDLCALNGSQLAGFSVARRMSWAASHQTTRLEDMAYCLLGIFDINMPLLYGEGHKAFIRL